ncbi:MAG: carboxypeptidase-like regulatory domain-containing protein [Bacteroidota bacterium]
MKKVYTLLLLFLAVSTLSAQEEMKKLYAKVVNDADDKPMKTVHVVNLTTIKGVITNEKGEFEIDAKADDVLFFSFLGFKSIKVRVTNDMLKYKGSSTIRMTELAFALEKVVLTPYQLTGYLEIDAKNVPIRPNYRYRIAGLSTGYEAGEKAPGAISSVLGAIFNPADFLQNLFGKKPQQMRKLRRMKEDDKIRDLLSSKFDRQMLRELLQVERVDIDEILSLCNYSKTFITNANDLQVLDAINDCYEEYKVLSRQKKK